MAKGFYRVNIPAFVAKHRGTYLRFTALGMGLVMAFATVEILLLFPHPALWHFIVPLLLGTVVGLMISTLAALRREILDGQRMFRAVADMAREFIYVRRIDGFYEYVSPSCEQLTGYSAAEFYARPSFMSSLVHVDDRPAWDRHVHQMDHHGQPEKLVIRINTRSGEQRWIEHLCTDVRDAHGNIIGVRSANLDITGRIEHERELAIAAVAFETHEAILITDREARILRVNRAFCDITGYAADEVIGRTPALFKSGRHDAKFYAEMWATLHAQGRWAGEMWDRRKDGVIYPKYQTITAVTDLSGAVAYYVSTFSDITLRKEAEAEIHRLAYFDPLTNLPNRRLLQDRIHQALAGSSRSGSYGALLLLDIDHFKNLNDTRGHAVGDQLLVETARRIRARVREGDTVARLGGDEFVVMLEDLGEEAGAAAVETELVGEKIRDAVAARCNLEGYAFHCTASIGITLFHGNDEPVEAILKHADMALYKAKSAGRDALRFFDPAMQTALDARSALEADLRVAVERGQLQLYYQAQVDGPRCVIGAEALLRWRHPERGLVAPGDFIPLAEDTGLILPIGHWVLQTACAQIRVWADLPATRDLRLAVNVSARQFRQPDFVAQVRQILTHTGADPTRLKIELTESMVLDDVGDTFGKMKALKSQGVGFSLDDFGTGNSSLSYLTRLPLDQLKIDRSFVLNLPDNGSDAIIAQTIITMGRSLGLDVIAEGVETEAQREFLDRHGCHAYQGFLFSRPLPLDEFEGFLQRTPCIQ